MENLAMKELERGREYVNQLQRLMILKSDNGEDGEVLMTSYAQDLAAKVEDSLRKAILLLNYQLSGVSADSPPNSDESHGRCESRSHTLKDPTRFSPQKRKSIQTWEDYSKIGPKEDGYAWRKYGEKFILNAKHPRCYFRCTYKYEKGCEATKQVQKIQESPPLYRTTYFGYHTCSKPSIFLDPHHLPSSSTGLISFNENHNDETTWDQNSNCKQESINDYAPPSSTSNDCLLSPTGEVLLFQCDELMDVISSSKIWRSSVRIASN